MRPAMPAALFAAALLFALPGCRIVHNGSKEATDPSDPNNFNAKKYVDKIWDSRVAPYYHDAAHPLPAVLAALAKDKDAAGKAFGHQSNPGGSPWTFVVSGSGVVESVNTASRHGELVVKVGAPDHPVDVTLQIGPVVFGTAVRDALPFIAFGDFVNQIQYAEVSRALNDRAVASAAQGLSAKPAPGQDIAFSGAMIDPAEAGGVVVTPVEIHLGQAAPR